MSDSFDDEVARPSPRNIFSTFHFPESDVDDDQSDIDIDSDLDPRELMGIHDSNDSDDEEAGPLVLAEVDQRTHEPVHLCRWWGEMVMLVLMDGFMIVPMLE